MNPPLPLLNWTETLHLSNLHTSVEFINTLAGFFLSFLFFFFKLCRHGGVVRPSLSRLQLSRKERWLTSAIPRCSRVLRRFGRAVDVVFEEWRWFLLDQARVVRAIVRGKLEVWFFWRFVSMFRERGAEVSRWQGKWQEGKREQKLITFFISEDGIVVCSLEEILNCKHSGVIRGRT